MEGENPTSAATEQVWKKAHFFGETAHYALILQDDFEQLPRMLIQNIVGSKKLPSL